MPFYKAIILLPPLEKRRPFKYQARHEAKTCNGAEKVLVGKRSTADIDAEGIDEFNINHCNSAGFSKFL